MILAWNADQSQPNPYDDPPIEGESTFSQSSFELRDTFFCVCSLPPLSSLELTVKECLEVLGREELEAAGRGVLAPHSTTASRFLAAALDLQEQQYVFALLNHARILTVVFLRRVLLSTPAKTADERLKRQTMRNKLSQRISSWRQIQLVYMPIISTLRPVTQESEGGEYKPELEKLWMPSDIDGQRRASGLASGLVEMEVKLRECEAQDALHQVSLPFSRKLFIILTVS